jgi:hypothetical protein
MSMQTKISAIYLAITEEELFINAWGDYPGGSRPKLETTQTV